MYRDFFAEMRLDLGFVVLLVVQRASNDQFPVRFFGHLDGQMNTFLFDQSAEKEQIFLFLFLERIIFHAHAVVDGVAFSLAVLAQNELADVDPDLYIRSDPLGMTGRWLVSADSL